MKSIQNIQKEHEIYMKNMVEYLIKHIDEKITPYFKRLKEKKAVRLNFYDLMMGHIESYDFFKQNKTEILNILRKHYLCNGFKIEKLIFNYFRIMLNDEDKNKKTKGQILDI